MPSIRRFLRWVAATVFAGLVLAILGSVVGEFFVEWARENDYYKDPSKRVENAVTWLSNLVQEPWFIYSTVAVGAFALGLWLDHFLRRKSADGLAKSPAPKLEKTTQPELDLPDPDPFDVYEGPAHDTLIRFVTRHLLPTCSAQMLLQRAILKEVPTPTFISHLAESALWKREEHRSFANQLSVLQGLGGSPPDMPSLRQLIIAVGRLEEHDYRFFCEQRNDLGRAANLNFRGDPKTSLLNAEWRDAHNDMVKAYENIKQNTAFNTTKTAPDLPCLWRPMRPSRWGSAD